MSRRSRRKRDQSGDEGGQGWLTTYSDLMSLLLTFFILLYSMSNIDAIKFQRMSQSLQGVLSGLGYTQIIDGPDQNMDIPDDDESPIGEDADSIIMQEIMGVYNSVVDYVDEQGLDAEVTVNMNKRGVYVDIKEAILFESGKADLKAEGIGVLDKLKGIFNDFNNEIVVEGHTDNVPMHSPQFDSNWELSTGRAVAVLRYLENEGNIDPKRLSATGYGEHRPIEANDTVEKRANNRRVHLLIIFDEEGNEVSSGGDKQ